MASKKGSIPGAKNNAAFGGKVSGSATGKGGKGMMMSKKGSKAKVAVPGPMAVKGKKGY